jgi:hypothetical protein
MSRTLLAEGSPSLLELDSETAPRKSTEDVSLPGLGMEGSIDSIQGPEQEFFRLLETLLLYK